MEKATFAAGCFWGVQLDLDRLEGVISTVVGYCGGRKEAPTYDEVCGGTTGHAEAVEVIFDPGVITFGELLDIFWRLHNPTTLDRQGPDRGSQYRSAIFYHTEEQKQLAEKSRAECDAGDLWDNPLVTEIMPSGPFWPAEDYHQKYLETRNIKISCH